MEKLLKDKRIIAFLVLPTAILYISFVLYPIINNLFISLFRDNLMGKSQFIGFKNYTNLFKDRFFLKALHNNLFLIIGSLLAHMPLALFFGNAIFNKIKGSKFFQVVFFLPTVISGVAVGIIFEFVYNSEFGLLNSMLEFFHLSQYQTSWLADERTVMFALIFVVMWRYVGYHMVIQLAAMREIPDSLFESASLDGATKWQKFKFITFPLMKPILKIDAVLIITGSLKYYDIIAVMTKGGPNHASEVISTYMFYQGFRTLKFGYASAMGMILLILCLIAIWTVNKAFGKEK